MSQNKSPVQIQLSNNRSLSFDRPLVMGILNVTPDSFSDGGDFATFDKALDQALAMVSEGADIIDVGGESSRPGAEPVTVEIELERVLPVIEALRKVSDIPISIDTYKAKTAQKALEAGVDFVNDISALRFDREMAVVVAKHNAPLIMMHMLGTPQNMQENPAYNNCTEEILGFLRFKSIMLFLLGSNGKKYCSTRGLGLASDLRIILSY